MKWMIASWWIIIKIPVIPCVCCILEENGRTDLTICLKCKYFIEFTGSLVLCGLNLNTKGDIDDKEYEYK